MTVVSDTNILSSFAAALAFPLLQHVFANTAISIPPTVYDELHAGVVRGRAYLDVVLAAIDHTTIKVLSLSQEEQALLMTLPNKLNAGEREALALCQQRRHLLLSNDRRAVRYAEANGIAVLDLPTLLRVVWTRGLATRAEVEELIARMEQVERLRLNDAQRLAIFAPQRKRR